MTVIPYYSAVSWCQGCHQSLQFPDLYIYLVRFIYQISSYLKVIKGTANQKRLGPTALIHNFSPYFEEDLITGADSTDLDDNLAEDGLEADVRRGAQEAAALYWKQLVPGLITNFSLDIYDLLL